MTRLILGFLAALSIAWNQDKPTDVNVNSRYTVEGIEVLGEKKEKLSKSIRKDLDKLVGAKFDPGAVADLAKRIRKELRARSVAHKVEKGLRAEHVRVIFEVSRKRFDIDTVPASKGVYHSRQGWTGDLTVNIHGLLLGVASNQDDLIERFAGFRAGFQNDRMFTERVGFRFLFESFHAQWHPNTLGALAMRPDLPGIYRERTTFQPSLTVALTRELTLTSGFDFERLQIQYPAVRWEGAHVAVNTLRYRPLWENSSRQRHELDAAYTLRAATRILSSDFVYTSHAVRAEYRFTSGRERLILQGHGGVILGQAPLFERFSLGNSDTLRGWSKLDIFPLGGTRQSYGSVEYRHAWGEVETGVFYEAGSAWDKAMPAVVRHAAGITLGSRKDGPYFAIAFPLTSGRLIPIFTLAMRF